MNSAARRKASEQAMSPNRQPGVAAWRRGESRSQRDEILEIRKTFDGFDKRGRPPNVQGKVAASIIGMSYEGRRRFIAANFAKLRQYERSRGADGLAADEEQRRHSRWLLVDEAYAGNAAALDVLPLVCHPDVWHAAYDANGRSYRNRPRYKARKRPGQLGKRQRQRQRQADGTQRRVGRPSKQYDTK